MESNPKVEPLDPAKARRVIWIALLILGALQAWAARYTTTPDGISYVDLSDAVVTGHLGGLLNAYWSPLYPALLGILRLILRPSPYWEFGVQHLLNLLLFAASIAAFEYFINALADSARGWGRRELDSTGGRVIAYLIFGVFSLMMTPLTLPTPDLLVTTTVFVTFGALLRLHSGAEWRRPAIVLGAALATASLAKSFCIPWSVICLVVALVATRRRWAMRPTAIAAGIWVAVAVPWCVALSIATGHVTFGDTGRLTYVWYVNQVQSPSNKMMPQLTATPATAAILPGTAIIPNGQGTNPVWYDPARWYGDLRPEFHASQQLAVFSSLVSQYVGSLAPVIVLFWFAFAVARRGDRAAWWAQTWVIVIPSIAAVGAYSLVLVTTRYVAPFYVAISLMLWIGLRWPTRLDPARIALGLGIPFLIMVSPTGTGLVIAYENAAVGSLLFAWMARRRGPIAIIGAGVVGAMAIFILQPSNLETLLFLGAVMVVMGYWLTGRLALRRGEGQRFSTFVRRGLMITSGLTIGIVAVLKYKTSIQPLDSAPSEPNVNWTVVEGLRRIGVPDGVKVALVGSPFESYWARTGRHQIVAIVSSPSILKYRELSLENRTKLFDEFAKAGAKVVVDQRFDSPDPKDPSWVVVPYLGWVKRLPSR